MFSTVKMTDTFSHSHPITSGACVREPRTLTTLDIFYILRFVIQPICDLKKKKNCLRFAAVTLNFTGRNT